MISLGTLRSYDLRRIWPNEARNFTAWLSENLERLSSALGMSIEFRKREQSVGPYSLDIFAHDVLRDRPVIIENQLEQTDHDHLGKLITYAAGLEASAIIWIAPSFREQHRAAIDWLNNHTDDSLEFFAVALEAVQIDDSKPAINFKVVAFPNTWQKSFAGKRSEVETDDDRLLYFYRFNEAVLDALRAKGTFSNLPTPRARYELLVQTTNGGVRYRTAFSRGILRVGIWIDSPDKARNRRLFDLLQAQKESLNAALDDELQWDFLAARHGQIVTIQHPVDRSDDSRIATLAEWAADAVTKIYKVFEPRIIALLPAAESTAEDALQNGGV